jgi:hypothetical protein
MTAEARARFVPNLSNSFPSTPRFGRAAEAAATIALKP